MKSLLGVVPAMLLALTGCRGRDAGLPSGYRSLPVPEAMLVSRDARTRGRELFVENCAICHGDRGDGNGIRREGLYPPPRDFTNPDWRKEISPRRVFFVIREGVSGTPMPSWKSFSDNDTWALAAYVLSIGRRD